MRSVWLRWTVPPGISLIVHAALIGIVAWVGVRLSASRASHERMPIVELALPAPPEAPQEQSDEQPPPESSEPAPQPMPSNAAEPDAVEAQAQRLDQARAPAGAPAMDPASRAALGQQLSESIRPESASPPSVQFAGVRSRAARTIVYVVDGSGATANSFAYLQSQLMRSIGRLSPTQRFQVVLFRDLDERPVSLAPVGNGRLARATPEHKQAVGDWLASIASRGRSNPLAGLEAALALRPDLVLLVTRSIQRTEMGWAQGQREILARLDTLNPADATTGRRKTIIKTIQLLDEDPTGIMRAIGTIHGDQASGVDDNYRVVTYDDLAAPDESEDLRSRSIGASAERRIESAGEILGSLMQSGTGFALLYSVGDATQRDEAAQSARRVRSLLADLTEEDGRAALLDAQALLMMRAADPSAVDDEALGAIVQTLGSVMYTDPGTDAQRELSVAMALAMRGQHERALSRVRELRSLADELGLDESVRAQALLAQVALGDEPADLDALANGPPFVTPSGNADAVWGLLLREATTKARLSRGEPDAWQPMLGVRRGNAGSGAMRGYIDKRIALLLEAVSPRPEPGALPTPVLRAAAGSLSRSSASRERAMGMLAEIASRTAEPEAAGDALWELGVLGRAINSDDSVARSNEALTELARRYPDHPRAADAVASAIGTTGTRDPDALRRRLCLAIDQYPDHAQADLWRLDLAELLTDFARLDVLDPVTPGTREGVLAGELYERTVLAMLERYDDGQIRLGLGVRMREAAERWAMNSAPLWTKRAAVSEIVLDPERGLGSIDRLIRDAKAGNRPTAELELMRAQTLLRLGQTRTAFAALRDLSSRIDATGRRSSTYWQAWALMLEAIGEHGSDADRADALRQIARLGLIDPELGGSPWRERIIAARRSLHSDS